MAIGLRVAVAMVVDGCRVVSVAGVKKSLEASLDSGALHALYGKTSKTSGMYHLVPR